MASYDGWRAQPQISFPLSGPPVCVAFGSPSYPAAGCMRPVHDERVVDSQFMELNHDIQDATTLAEKFDLEPSKEHHGLLHVRCCLTKKYWVPQQVHQGSPWFVCGAADEPEEDVSKPSCTLFDLRPDSKHDERGTALVRIFNAQHKKYASVYFMYDPSKRGKTYLKLRDDQQADSTLNLFSVRHLSNQKELPKYVAFQGANGTYLNQELQFSPSEITDPSVVHETFTDEYGVVRIRSTGSGRFWRLGANNWIRADSDDPVDSTGGVYKDACALFKVVMKGDNYIALQNISNGKFCKLDEGTRLIAASTADAKEAKFLFEEPIKSREIYDVVYHVAGKKSATDINPRRRNISRDNLRPDQTDSGEEEIILTDRTDSTWNLHLQVDAGIDTHLTASLPFKIFDIEGGIEGHLGFHGEYNLKKTKINERKRTVKYKFPVPPMTRVTCSLYLREDVVDVPFSYKERVVLFSGEIAPPVQFHGGIYSGRTSYNTDIDIYEEKITDGEKDASSVI